jgi:hypothetical protein
MPMPSPPPGRPVHPSVVIAAVVLAGAVGAAAVVLIATRWATPAAATEASSTALSKAAGRPVTPPPSLEPQPSHTVQQLMVGLVDPAADGIWNSAGSIVTPTSEETWAPSTDIDWQRLEGHARALARGAEALLDPARVDGREDWALPARGLRTASAAALAAAQHRDTTAIYAASEQLLDACQQCHRHYWLPTESSTP